jgi:tetratricopeptide (TPR) repeat protein
VKGLRVISRTSAFAFKGKEISIPEIAAELGVEHVLEGSVRRAGNRVRITTQLIEVATDSHLWSESYDRELNDIFAVQDEIAKMVGDALKVALLGADSQPLHSTPETTVDVYNDYLLARQKMVNTNVANTRESERLLKSVIERDPGYAPAYSALAEAYEIMSHYGLLSSTAASALMAPLVEQALAIDDRLASAWQLLAFVRGVNGDFEGARAAETNALELDPKNPKVLSGQISRWRWTHEPERGLVYANELIRVDPLSVRGFFLIFRLYARMGNHDAAQTMIDRMGSIDPHAALYFSAAQALAATRNDLVSAIGWIWRFIKSDSRDPEGPATIAYYYFALGDVAAAEFWNNKALQIDPNAPIARLNEAVFYRNNKEEPKALQIARELTQPGSQNRFALRGQALRMLAEADFATGNYEAIITRYLTHYPELAKRKFPTDRLEIETSQVWEAFIVTLDLASGYLHAGEKAKAESLLSLVESELPYWQKASQWGSGVADAELHALRGEKEQAINALREHVARGSLDNWRFQLLFNPNLDSIRKTPEFVTIVAEIEADMADQLARVRELEKSGELEPIPNGVAE